ncbi:MAG: ThiF family adenylyltransferase [Dehalococcoidaceae bacterium]|nr:ThiF family adenylyltransferase [Dehalococcoidaceae bacterium]
MDYSKLIDRNWGLIPDNIQLQIRTTRILIAGCGLGSNVATLAARTGFSNFILADGDKVELSNLNRQAFRSAHLGMNKAQATAELISEINSEASISINPKFITPADVIGIVSCADIIINTVDPGPVMYELNDTARAQQKTVMFPLNTGFGGITLVFTPTSSTLEEMIGGKFEANDFFMRLLQSLSQHAPHLETYFKEYPDILQAFVSSDKPGPQLGVAANINAALIVTAIVRLLSGLPVKQAPQPLALDASVINQ